MHGTTIQGLDHDLMQLLKTPERKVVMFNIPGVEIEWNF